MPIPVAAAISLLSQPTKERPLMRALFHWLVVQDRIRTRNPISTTTFSNGTGVLYLRRRSPTENPNVRDAHTNPDTCATRTRTQNVRDAHANPETCPQGTRTPGNWTADERHRTTSLRQQTRGPRSLASRCDQECRYEASFAQPDSWRTSPVAGSSRRPHVPDSSSISRPQMAAFNGKNMAPTPVCLGSFGYEVLSGCGHCVLESRIRLCTVGYA